MDGQTFDRLIAEAARRPSRRTALRLLGGGLLGALVSTRVARAQRPDRDEDGLFDDDETDVYGTNPDDWDTDDDNVGDGEEIYNRDNGLGGNTNPLVNENAAPPPADNGGADAPPAATCTAVGGGCSSNTCCQADPNYTYVQCCFDANGYGVCTDVAASGTFHCPDPGVPSSGCPVGQTNCGGFCTDLSIDHGNCGACGHSCGLGFTCTTGACIQACPSGGQTICNSVCVDLLTDIYNCGACGSACACTFDRERCQICSFGVCTYV
jgi:hypothetical protein